MMRVSADSYLMIRSAWRAGSTYAYMRTPILSALLIRLAWLLALAVVERSARQSAIWGFR